MAPYTVPLGPNDDDDCDDDDYDYEDYVQGDEVQYGELVKLLKADPAGLQNWVTKNVSLDTLEKVGLQIWSLWTKSFHSTGL